jgi:hypothetical protein
VSAGWVGASVRARLLLRRRIGERAAELARSPSLREALVGLTGTAYGRELEPGVDLETAQHEVAAATLLHLRLLSGWLPPGKVGFLRALAGWYELANVEDRLAYLAGADLRPPFDLGGLASAWPRASRALSAAELRNALAGSAWGDPGGEAASDVHLGLRAAWAERLLADLPELRELVAGALALLLARELFVTGRPADSLAELHLPTVGSDWEQARTLGELAAALPSTARWALEGIEAPQELWHAEIRWWTHVEEVGRRLARSSREGRAAVTGSVLLLAADTWWTAAALAAAERGGLELREVLGGPR